MTVPTGEFDGRVVYITGIARGQGRNHAIRFAREGAAIIGMDCADRASEHTNYPPATPADLDRTRELVEAEGGRILVRQGDVRDLAFQKDLVAEGVSAFGGRLDHIVTNAAILTWDHVWEMSEDTFTDTIDVNLTGAWRSLRAAVPHMLAAGNGGSIVIVSSASGLKAMPAQCAYSASKFGLVGLAQSAAKELGRHRIRVNTLNQYGVNTPMGLEDSRGTDIITGDPFYGPHFVSMMPDIPVAEVDDISDSVLFLCSERARVITGATFQADMGWTKV